MADQTSWKFKLIVNNTTDRKLSLKNKNLNWGHWDLGDKEAPPIDIEARSNQEVLGIRASHGTWTGYQCSCSWVDETKGKESYGSLSLEIDVPFTADNHSKLQKNGYLYIDGWSDLPKRGHHFIRSIDISLIDEKLQVTGDRIESDVFSPEDEEYSSYLDQLMTMNDTVADWEKLKKIEELSYFDPLAKLPGKYKLPPIFLIGRSPIMEIPQKEWPGVGDPIFESFVQKKKYVKEYFAVGIYTVNTDTRATETIVAGVTTAVETTAVETTVEVTSAIKNTLATHYSIKTSLSAKGTDPKKSVELAATLESEFKIDSAYEESCSKLERETRKVEIAPSEKIGYLFNGFFPKLSQFSGEGRMEMFRLLPYRNGRQKSLIMCMSIDGQPN